jgi:hypothetical protein
MALQTAKLDTGPSIGHAKYTIDEWPFIVVCVALASAFLAFGLVIGFPLAIGAGMFFSNVCWLMVYENPSTTPVVLASYGNTLPLEPPMLTRHPGSSVLPSRLRLCSLTLNSDAFTIWGLG